VPVEKRPRFGEPASLVESNGPAQVARGFARARDDERERRRLAGGRGRVVARRHHCRDRERGDDGGSGGDGQSDAVQAPQRVATLFKALDNSVQLVQVPVIGLEEARELLDGDALFLDVREQSEWDLGHIPGALHIPRAQVDERIREEAPDKTQRIVVYCARGERSRRAGQTLLAQGYETVENLIDGFIGWERRGLPSIVPSTLPEAQRRRYSRHLLIPEVGEEGQRTLLNARVLLVGAGGLGSPASLYLAAAGVGTIGIVDADVVDDSNLQRQIVHSTARLGEPKVESARDTLEALNPDVEVRTFEERLTSENIDRILGEGWDVIVDGADNFPTRYLVNDASIWHDIPVVHGSIFRFEGQVTVFKPGAGPCYRCLFPTPPPPELAPSCAEGGVLGVLPGIIGSLQTSEALKIVLGIGEPLVGRLQLFDALGSTFTEVALRRDPDCPVCGDNPSITEYIDYVEFCGG
jgi:sulfur-carrier protein adenylyltransferase/sulfurtransferase